MSHPLLLNNVTLATILIMVSLPLGQWWVHCIINELIDGRFTQTNNWSEPTEAPYPNTSLKCSLSDNCYRKIYDFFSALNKFIMMWKWLCLALFILATLLWLNLKFYLSNYANKTTRSSCYLDISSCCVMQSFKQSNLTFLIIPHSIWSQGPQ